MSDNYLYYDYATSSVCKVKEDIQEYVPDSSMHHFLDHLCILHGSTLEGRRDAFRILMNKSRFIPIVVNQNPHEIYFRRFNFSCGHPFSYKKIPFSI